MPIEETSLILEDARRALDETYNIALKLLDKIYVQDEVGRKRTLHFLNS
jgi:hypothetical protein